MPKRREGLHKSKQPEGTVLVRCLGLDPEHEFYSTDPTTHRICKWCRNRIDEMRISQREMEGYRAPDPRAE